VSYLAFPSEFCFDRTWDDGDRRTVRITRYTNHGRFVEDGAWVVCIVLGPMNPWYLGEDGGWRYKSGVAFGSHEAAYEAFGRSESPRASAERAQRGDAA
jgi:hypothetical protein